MYSYNKGFNKKADDIINSKGVLKGKVGENINVAIDDKKTIVGYLYGNYL